MVDYAEKDEEYIGTKKKVSWPLRNKIVATKNWKLYNQMLAFKNSNLSFTNVKS